MKITINGKEEVVRKGMTVAELIELKKVNPDAVIVEYNHDFIKREAWVDIVLEENDVLEVLRFVGGG